MKWTAKTKCFSPKQVRVYIRDETLTKGKRIKKRRGGSNNGRIKGTSRVAHTMFLACGLLISTQSYLKIVLWAYSFVHFSINGMKYKTKNLPWNPNPEVCFVSWELHHKISHWTPHPSENLLSSLSKPLWILLYVILQYVAIPPKEQWSMFIRIMKYIFSILCLGLVELCDLLA